MADFLSQQLSALEKRLGELRPQVEEYLHLERVKEALEGVGGAGPGARAEAPLAAGPAGPRAAPPGAAAPTAAGVAAAAAAPAPTRR